MADTTAPAPVATVPAQGEWGYEDYLALPDDGQRYEMIEGVLYVTPAPKYSHQVAVTKLTSYLDTFVTEQQLGIVLTAPFEVRLPGRVNVVQPDVLFIRAENVPEEDVAAFTGVPDMVVEVLSPATKRVDEQTKFAAYEKAGVREYWLVNPKTRSVAIYTLEGDEYALAGEYVGDETIASIVLDGLRIVTSTLFLPLQ